MGERYFIGTDDSGHYYFIPMRHHKLWRELIDRGEKAIGEFEDAFGEYRLAMHLGCYSFSDPQEIK